VTSYRRRVEPKEQDMYRNEAAAGCPMAAITIYEEEAA